MDPLAEKAFRIIVGFSLHILRHGDADGAGIGGVGQHAHGGDHGAHQLLGADDAVPIPADSAEGVVGGERQIMDLLHLLQHRIRLAAGIDIAGQDQHGDVVGRSGGCGGDHVGSTGTNGTGDRDDLLSLALPGKGHGGMGHALLILPLPDLHSVGLLAQSLPKAHHVAVAGQHDHTLHERMLDAVIGDILVFQEADHGLCHSQTYGFHRLPPYPLKMWSLASGFQSQACSGSSMRVFSQGSPSRCRIPQE